MRISNLSELVAVLLSEREQANLVDCTQIARSETDGYKALQFSNPQTTALNVNVLPTGRLDVGVRDVARTQAALS